MKPFKEYITEAQSSVPSAKDLKNGLSDALSSLSVLESYIDGDSLTKDKVKNVIFQMNKDMKLAVDSYKKTIKELSKKFK